MSFCINPKCSNPNNQDTMLFCQSCGSELLLDGRYRVQKELGGGGFANTYEVRDCSPSSMYNPQSTYKVLKLLLQNQPKYIELFKREAEVLMSLNHPGIPKVEPDGYFTIQLKENQQLFHCIVMEKIEGLDIAQYIYKRGRPIKERLALEWLIQIATILQEVHSHNFFHRDIKPSNIMLRADGQLVLIDFGTVREITNTYLSKQSAGMVTGVISTGYTPVEQMNGQAVPQSDFFALGRTMVFLLTGKDPSDFYDSYIDDLRWREFLPQIPPILGDFIDYLMARIPSQRPQTANEVLEQAIAIYKVLYTEEGLETSISGKPQVAINPVRSKNTSSSSPTIHLHPKTTNNGETDDFLPQPLLNKQFITTCQQKLAQYIGPMASIVCQRTIKQNPGISGRNLVYKLAATIPNLEQAEEFKRKLL
ncbi:MAG: serine/threonine protein kinase [Cyanobacteria bacterium J083]|nr:MAG: serine/threonine protein kinase [Cyanobacteria bacterium J083]